MQWSPSLCFRLRSRFAVPDSPGASRASEEQLPESQRTFTIFMGNRADKLTASRPQPAVVPAPAVAAGDKPAAVEAATSGPEVSRIRFNETNRDRFQNDIDFDLDCWFMRGFFIASSVFHNVVEFEWKDTYLTPMVD